MWTTRKLNNFVFYLLQLPDFWWAPIFSRVCVCVCVCLRKPLLPFSVGRFERYLAILWPSVTYLCVDHIGPDRPPGNLNETWQVYAFLHWNKFYKCIFHSLSSLWNHWTSVRLSLMLSVQHFRNRAIVAYRLVHILLYLVIYSSQK